MIYLWSDTHFNHKNIIQYTGRDYDNVEQMNECLILAWNNTVKPSDTIYHLGDFGFARGGQQPLADVFDRLIGHKHLIVGNHDERNPDVMKLPWESIAQMATLKEQGVRAVVCHYPLESWKSAHRGYLMLHGHSHGSLKRKLPHRFDIGVDVEPRPVTLQEMAVRASEETFLATDHHAEV